VRVGCEDTIITHSAPDVGHTYDKWICLSTYKPVSYLCVSLPHLDAGASFVISLATSPTVIKEVRCAWLVLVLVWDINDAYVIDAT
jgi:hypothetical protein